MIVPKKLAEDYRELEYIESLSKSKIGLSEQVHNIINHLESS
jgi:hypothetical protein